MRRRLINRKGFSLAETLLAMWILALVAMFLANGVPLAKSAYERIVINANARVLMSTAITALRDELTTARDIRVGGADDYHTGRVNLAGTLEPTTITYYSADRGATSMIFLAPASDAAADNDKLAIWIDEYIDLDPTPGKTPPSRLRSVPVRNLVPPKAVKQGLRVAYEGPVTLTNEGITIKNLAVYKHDADGTRVVGGQAMTLTIRFIKPLQPSPLPTLPPT